MSRLSRLDVDAYRTWLAEESFSGVVHVAGDDDEAPVTIAFGAADRAAGLPIRAGTRFGIASTAKMLTGLAIARLVDRGVLRYEDRYGDLVDPELRPRDLDPAVTLEHLLSHTWVGYGTAIGSDGAAQPSTGPSPSALADAP